MLSHCAAHNEPCTTAKCCPGTMCYEQTVCIADTSSWIAAAAVVGLGLLIVAAMLQRQRAVEVNCAAARQDQLPCLVALEDAAAQRDITVVEQPDELVVGPQPLGGVDHSAGVRETRHLE